MLKAEYGQLNDILLDESIPVSFVSTAPQFVVASSRIQNLHYKFDGCTNFGECWLA